VNCTSNDNKSNSIGPQEGGFDTSQWGNYASYYPASSINTTNAQQNCSRDQLRQTQPQQHKHQQHQQNCPINQPGQAQPQQHKYQQNANSTFMVCSNLFHHVTFMFY
jgi:hypothetical protein